MKQVYILVYLKYLKWVYRQIIRTAFIVEYKIHFTCRFRKCTLNHHSIILCFIRDEYNFKLNRLLDLLYILEFLTFSFLIHKWLWILTQCKLAVSQSCQLTCLRCSFGCTSYWRGLFSYYYYLPGCTMFPHLPAPI